MLVRRMTGQLAREGADNGEARVTVSSNDPTLYNDNNGCREEGRRKASTGHLSDPF